jgi:senataxin
MKLWTSFMRLTGTLSFSNIHARPDANDGIYSELKSFPAEAHWFCPKRRDDDPIDYENPDEAEEEILGMDPEHSGTLREDYIQRLDQLLKACDKCVHNWHLGRKAFLKECSE